MATNKSEEDKKVFDVAHPGKTAASSSGRPLIIGHKAIIKDPMVKDSATNEMDEGKEVKIDQPIEEDLPSGSPPLPSPEEAIEKAAAKAIAPSEANLVIKPLDDDSSKDESDEKEEKSEITAPVLPEAVVDKEVPEEEHKVEVKVNKSNPKSSKKEDDKSAEKAAAIASIRSEKPEDEKTEKLAGDKKTNEIEPESTPEEKSDSDDSQESEKTDDNESKDEEEPKNDESADKENTSDSENGEESNPADSIAQKKAEQEAQAQVAKKEQVDKLIASKQYVVPIGEKTRKRRSLKHVLTGAFLILLLGGALAYLMADVGIINTNYELPYHFFKQAATETSNTPVPATTTDSTATTTKTTTASNVYKSKAGSVSFTYPKDWEKQVLDPAGKRIEQVGFSPSEDSKDDISITLGFESYKTVDASNVVIPSSDLKMAKSTYTELNKTGGKTLYLREIIYKATDSTGTRYYLYANVTDAKVNEVAGSISILKNEIFTSADGKTTFQYNVTPIDYDDKTLAAVEKYAKTDKNYLAAKASLATIKFVKQ